MCNLEESKSSKSSATTSETSRNRFYTAKFEEQRRSAAAGFKQINLKQNTTVTETKEVDESDRFERKLKVHKNSYIDLHDHHNERLRNMEDQLKNNDNSRLLHRLQDKRQENHLELLRQLQLQNELMQHQSTELLSLKGTVSQWMAMKQVMAISSSSSAAESESKEDSLPAKRVRESKFECSVSEEQPRPSLTYSIQDMLEEDEAHSA
jgi:hypothetical protein